jgi:hypothetical protein
MHINVAATSELNGDERSALAQTQARGPRILTCGRR